MTAWLSCKFVFEYILKFGCFLIMETTLCRLKYNNLVNFPSDNFEGWLQYQSKGKEKIEELPCERFLQVFELSRAFLPPISHGKKCGKLQNPVKNANKADIRVFISLLINRNSYLLHWVVQNENIIMQIIFRLHKIFDLYCDFLTLWSNKNGC